MTTVVREREWETESARSGPRYTTVRRYKVPEKTEDHDDRYETRIIRREREVPRESLDDDRFEEMRIIRREREPDPPPPPPRHTHRELPAYSYRIVDRSRNYSAEPERPRSEFRYVRERSPSRSPSPKVREWRYERDFEPPVRSSPYELEKYSKSTEYFSHPEPQPIVIRQETPQPIIIREEAHHHPQQVIIKRDEPSYDIVEHSEVEVSEEKSVTAPAPAPEPPKPEPEYYYERVVREVERPRREEHREHREPRRRDSWSEDDLVYVNERREGYGSRSGSPRHKLHLAEGVAAGLGAAALVRHHRKRQGEDPGPRGRQALGYGALGAVGAEAITRARSRFRSRSRSGSRDGSYHPRRRHRSRSMSNGKALAGVAALAGLGALAFAAGRNANKPQPVVIDDRRSRSRKRRHSVAEVRGDERGRSTSQSKHNDPEHRNKSVARAGLVGAALAGLAEHRRSKSRGRSKSRLRTGVPIAAAGLGSAAVAGLYEKARARSEKKKDAKEGRSRSRSRSASRSRSRSRSVPHERERSRSKGDDDRGLIEYGGDPIYSNTVARRSPSRDEPAEYRGRRRGSSASSTNGKRHRSHSRGLGAAGAAGAAAVAGVAAHEATKRRERKRAERERERQPNSHPGHNAEEGESGSAYGDPNEGYAGENRYYPATNEFPPPPPPQEYPPAGAPGQYHQEQYSLPPSQQYTPNQAYGEPMYGQPAPYNPADYAPQPGPTPQPEYYHQQPPSPSQEYYGPNHGGGYGRDPEHVGASSNSEHPDSGGFERGIGHDEDADSAVSDGLRTPRNVSPAKGRHGRSRSVQFDLPSAETTPEVTKDRQSNSHKGRGSDKETAEDDEDDRGRRHRRHSEDSHRKHKRSGSSESDQTVDLPPRFDSDGRRRDEDPIADTIEDLLSGRGHLGKMVHRFTGDLLSGSNSRRK
ncbi:hypothetical protein K402DRAFT_413330 [Aulographum hederae CBS 113979]|uniref:DUF3824 domain-containing protein n=1 Tax=Aulographum hederae CBS 113979 TaxID=1176131 RepID=A0A6G1GXG5_9PEZI|nr:hypothetical protein K402DRAFT_413330 [Aulographum hederae CBS 113979]